MYYVYILKLTSNKYCVGYTSNLKEGIGEHKRGKTRSTKNLSPELVFYSAFENKLKALRFERYLKSISGFAFRNKRLI